MLWVKAFHIVFVVSWYAGLLYLPRLFVYHAATEDERGLERFEIMERKLFGIMTIGAVGSVVLGGWLLSPWWNVLSSTDLTDIRPPGGCRRRDAQQQSLP